MRHIVVRYAGRIALQSLIIGVVIAVAFTIGAFVSKAIGQPPEGDAPQGAPMPLDRPTMARMLMRRMMMRAAPVAICATEKYVYVVRGNVLYQFTAEELELKKRVVLEDEMLQLRPMRGERRERLRVRPFRPGRVEAGEREQEQAGEGR